MRELLVRTGNRDALDRTLQQLGGLVCDTPEPDGSYIVRAFPPSDIKLNFLKFAMTQQGYAEVVGEREIDHIAEATEFEDVTDEIFGKGEQ